MDLLLLVTLFQDEFGSTFSVARMASCHLRIVVCLLKL